MLYASRYIIGAIEPPGGCVILVDCIRETLGRYLVYRIEVSYCLYLYVRGIIFQVLLCEIVFGVMKGVPVKQVCESGRGIFHIDVLPINEADLGADVLVVSNHCNFRRRVPVTEEVLTLPRLVYP